MSTPNAKPSGPPRNLLVLFVGSAVLVPACFYAGTRIDAWMRGDRDILKQPETGPAAALPPSDSPKERAKRRTALMQEAMALEEERAALDQRLVRVKERMAEKAAQAERDAGQVK